MLLEPTTSCSSVLRSRLSFVLFRETWSSSATVKANAAKASAQAYSGMGPTGETCFAEAGTLSFPLPVGDWEVGLACGSRCVSFPNCRFPQSLMEFRFRFVMVKNVQLPPRRQQVPGMFDQKRGRCFQRKMQDRNVLAGNSQEGFSSSGHAMR